MDISPAVAEYMVSGTVRLQLSPKRDRPGTGGSTINCNDLQLVVDHGCSSSNTRSRSCSPTAPYPGGPLAEDVSSMLHPEVAAVAEARGVLLQQVHEMISNMEVTCKGDGQGEQQQQQRWAGACARGGAGVSGAGGVGSGRRSILKGSGATGSGAGVEDAGGGGGTGQLTVKVSKHLRISDGQDGNLSGSGRIPASWSGEQKFV